MPTIVTNIVLHAIINYRIRIYRYDTIICIYCLVGTKLGEISSNNFPEVNNSQVSKYNIVLDQNHDKLPFLYFTAKMHKKPASGRFITSGKCSSLSELSVKVGRC